VVDPLDVATMARARSIYSYPPYRRATSAATTPATSPRASR
jgi:hypothetical protein